MTHLSGRVDLGCICVGGMGLEFFSGVSVWRGWKGYCEKNDELGSEFRNSSGVSMFELLNCAKGSENSVCGII